MSDELTAQTRHAYDTVARTYAEVLPDMSFEDPLDLAMIDHFVSRLRADARILDAGCGAGRMLAYLTRRSASLALEGVDLSPAMVAEARAAHPTFPIDEGDVADLPHETGAFDGILAWYSIIHTPPRASGGVLEEFHRVLAPGGLLLVAYQAGTGERTSSRPYGHEVELRTFLHETGDVVARLHRTGFTVRARLDRSARETEKHDQGFVLAERR
ncbi:methyltransferase [Frondihabitans sucicola]|uniref:Methyltransferase n=1 Tax=Frondihabitans sucicola TaxID=1268041 RepID=A0ABN6XXV9_9MICO|nr:class I SAM-dependent methyltransferase [Frondihabitans sucicola]BDZ48480.1 methyltransferase [Frondihabitans sucicola]